MVKIILASQSKVRKEILDKNQISTDVQPSNVDEDVIKEIFLKKKPHLKSFQKIWLN